MSRPSPQLPGLWPTPTAKLSEGSQTHRSGARSNELLLTGLVKALEPGPIWPTPTASEAGKSDNLRFDSLQAQVRLPGAPINPAWVLSLMGFPRGWV